MRQAGRARGERCAQRRGGPDTIVHDQCQHRGRTAPWPGRWDLNALLTLCVLLGELPLLIKFFADLWTRPQYDFFPLILIGAAYLAWDRLRDAPAIEQDGRSRVVGAIVLALAFLALAAGVLFLVRWLGGVSAWLALAGCVCWIGGFRLLRVVSPSLVLLLTIIPPPMKKDETIALTLRQWAVWASGRVLDLVQIPHVLTGTLINISGHRLGVEDACSGIHSLMAVVAVTLMLGFYWRRPAWRIAALMICSIIFVVWANILRIALGAYLIIDWKIDILSGSAHELLGLVLFLICIGLAASLDQFLDILSPGRRASDENGATSKSNDPAPMPASSLNNHGGGSSSGRKSASSAKTASTLTVSRRTGGRYFVALAWCAAGAFALLGGFAEYRVAGLWVAPSLGASARFNLPATLAGWERVEGSEQVIGRPEVLGQYSSIWNYRRGSHSVLIAFDYPFPGYHELATCYQASGWQLARATPRGKSDVSGADGAYMEMEMDRPSPAYAYLLYGCCDEQGRWLTADTIGDVRGLRLAMYFSYQRAKAPQAYQVQVLAQGFQAPGADEKKQIESLFLATRAEFARQLVQQVEAK